MLIFFDSFDHYATEQLDLKWDSHLPADEDPPLATNISATIASGTGRRGGGALSLGAGASANKEFTAAQTVIVGVAHNSSELTALGDIIKFYDGATLQVSIKIDSDGSIKAYHGDTTTLLGSSSAGAIVTGNFVYIEAKVKVHVTLGTVDVYVTPTQGATPIPTINLTGQNTQASGAAQCTAVQLYGPVGTTLFDDLYICDTTGTMNTDLLGDSRVDTIYPIHDGYYREFDTSAGAVHYSLVDESPPSGTDYVQGNGIADRDCFECSHIGSVTGTIKGVQVNNLAFKSAMPEGDLQLENLIRSGVTDGYSGVISLTTTAAYATSIHEVDPATAETWTEKNVNYAQFGARVAE